MLFRPVEPGADPDAPETPSAHEPYDLGAMVEAIASVGYDGSVAVDYRGDGDLTLGLLRSRSALELAITGGLAIAELLPELDEGEDEEEA
jgi:hypothetical protein